MKTFSIIAKIVVALAAIAGIVYVVATYGDKIVAWAKKLLCSCKVCNCENVVEEAAEETEAEEAIEESEASEEEVIASESDFEN